MLTVFSGIYLPVLSEEDTTQVTTRGARWSSYKAYYNQTFTINPAWEADNVSIAVLLQTDEQTLRNKDPQGSTQTPKFNSAEVLQSAIDFLDGTQTSTGTSRNVLGELFTATWCQYCPGGVGAFDRITRDSSFFPTKTTLVELHGSGDHGTTDGAARQSWYDFGGIPTAIFDGYECYTGGSTDPNATSPESHYKRIINNRAAIQSIVDITTFGHKTSTSGWINASVELLNPTPLRNLKVQFFVLEDLYPANNTGAFYRHTVQEILTPQNFIPTNHQPNVKSQLSGITILEDGSDSTSIQLAPKFEDEDLDVLTYHSNRDGLDKHNITVEIDDEGNVTLTPDANWNGVEEITFYANDNIIDSAGNTLTVTITSVNDAPTVANPMTDFTMFEDVSVEDKFDLNEVFDDVDIDPALNAIPQGGLEFTYLGNENIVVTIENDFVSFDPKPDWNGNETITITAKDSSSASASDNVRIWVRSGNDPPILSTPFPDTIIDEDDMKKDFLDLNDYFADTDGDALTFDYESSENLDVRLKGSLVTIIPEDNYWGTEVVTFKATDISGSEPVIGDMTVVIIPVNDLPILNTTENWILNKGGVELAGTNVEIKQDDEIVLYATAYDPADNDLLKFSDDTDLFDIDPDTGEIALTPTNDDVGTYEVNIKVDDQQATDNIVQTTFTFMIKNVNDPPETPVISSPEADSIHIVETDIEFKGTCDDPDLYLDDSTERLTYKWTTDQSTDILSFDREFATQLEEGVYTITLTVSDRADESTSTEITITVDIDRNKDTDNDGIADYLDEDDDNDGIIDSWELQYELDPLNANDANRDLDNDGFTNLEEFLGDDGKLGGQDSTNPRVKSSAPEVKDTSSSTDTNILTSPLVSLGIIAVIIIIIILIVLFFLIRRRRKAQEEPAEPVHTPYPAEQPPTSQAPQMMQQPPYMTQSPPYPTYQTPGQGLSQDDFDKTLQQYMQMSQQEQQPPRTTFEAQTDQLSIPDSTQPLPEIKETPLLPSPELEPKTEMPQELPTGGEMDEAPAQQLDESPVPETKAEPTIPSPSEPTSQTIDENCSHCGQPIKAGWVLCPNCKELI